MDETERIGRFGQGVAIRLCCHPATVPDVVRDLRASVGRPRAGMLDIGFRLAGEISRIRLPAPGAVRPGTRLWEHTCFEVFVAREREPAYHELNVAPSREWAVHAFRAYRDAAAGPCALPAPDVAVRRSDELIELDARVSLLHLSPSYAEARLRIGLCAVVETDDGRRSYWAIRHSSDKPDFHHADAFALWLEPPREG